MEGHNPQPLVTVQRVFAQTRFSEDWLAQAYEYVLRRLQQIPPSQESQATRPTRRRIRQSPLAATGGRKS
jgi:hypothetical protein